MTSSLRLWVRLGTLLLPIALVLGTTPSCAEDPAPAAPAPAAPAAAEGQSGSQPMTAAELEELVAPVALYPDVVLSAMLPGSTDIVNLVKLQRWVAELSHL